MTKEDILKLRDHCEVTKVQFKERITDKYDVGCEMVAFCNSHGGQLVIGINDKTGVMNPLSYQEVQDRCQEMSFCLPMPTTCCLILVQVQVSYVRWKRSLM